MTAGNTKRMDKGSRRVKLTVSLSSDLLRRIEKRRGKGVSRSAMFEQMLEESDRAARREALREELRAYYSAPETEEEKAVSLALYRAGVAAMASSEFANDDFSAWEPKTRKKKK
jgi:hypothetical protein